MDKKIKSIPPIEYQIGGTKYTVTPIHTGLAHKEALVDKIKRLILSDKERKDGNP
ncbi:MAG: hypothetical protein VB060_10875 [Oscillibacter sp.]|nr:hypothetical protein [Oscillibacter sp.]MEA4994308.1 hypothetical protein [Oscillibacter sp.]